MILKRKTKKSINTCVSNFIQWNSQGIFSLWDREKYFLEIPEQVNFFQIRLKIIGFYLSQHTLLCYYKTYCKKKNRYYYIRTAVRRFRGTCCCISSLERQFFERPFFCFFSCVFTLLQKLSFNSIRFYCLTFVTWQICRLIVEFTF